MIMGSFWNYDVAIFSEIVDNLTVTNCAENFKKLWFVHVHMQLLLDFFKYNQA